MKMIKDYAIEWERKAHLMNIDLKNDSDLKNIVDVWNRISRRIIV